jgi:hypothetical protein
LCIRGTRVALPPSCAINATFGVYRIQSKARAARGRPAA